MDETERTVLSWNKDKGMTGRRRPAHSGQCPKGRWVGVPEMGRNIHIDCERNNGVKLGLE